MFGISKRTLIACSILALPLLALPALTAQNEINGVNVVPGDGKVTIEISKAGAVSFNAFMMGDPTRLVINCVGATYHVPWKTKDVQSPLLNRVRTSQFQLDPLIVSRVVLDLATDVDYKMWAEGNKEVVEITKRAPDAMSSEVKEGTKLMWPLERPEVAQEKKASDAEPAKKSVGASQFLAQASMGPFLPYIPNLATNENSKAAASAKTEETKTEAAKTEEAKPETPAPVNENPAPKKTASELIAPAVPILPLVPVVPVMSVNVPAPAQNAAAPASPAHESNAPATAASSEKTKASEAASQSEVESTTRSEVESTAKNDVESTAASESESKTETPESPWITTEQVKSGEENAKENLSAAGEVAYSPLSETGKTESQTPWTSTYARGNPAPGSSKAMGSNRITVDAQGADIKTVLRTISDYSGKNIVYGPDVKGEVYVHIKDVPWEEALDILLRAHGYGYREEYGMIRVSEEARLTKEELELQSAERKKDDLLPLMTRIVFVNNASADEIKTALQNIVSSRGKLDVDVGSNALIVNDIEPVIEKIEEMVKSLDKKTFQVDINAKLVEVDVEATRELGINWGLLNLHASGVSGTGSAAVTSEIPLSAGTVKFGTVRSWGELNAVLQMLENSNKANIISNPRITTMDNRQASILVGKEIPLIVADMAGNPITELTKIGIMLKVVPHVNADRSITLDMHPEVSDLQSESTAQGGIIISTSEADTRVVVKNGETAVIGGLIKNTATKEKRGIPLLKDVPIIGGLFSSSSKADKKQELVIFVTPTIVE